MTDILGNWLDRLGVLASAICAFHCLALPAIAVALPVLGLNFLVSETAERYIILASVLIAVISLLPAYLRLHGKPTTLILAGSGLGLIVVTHFFLEEIVVLRFAFIIIGAALLAGGHILNIKYCRECDFCRQEQEGNAQT